MEVNGGEFEPISSVYRPACVLLVQAEIQRGREAAAELAALKARRCDGCVRWGAVYVSGLYAGMASCDGQPVDDCGCGAMPMTAPDHACNAWEARTDG